VNDQIRHFVENSRRK